MKRLALCLAIALALSPPALAQWTTFNPTAESTIRAWFQANPLTPQDLPAATKLEKGKALPAGLAWRPIPGHLASKLPPFPDDHEVGIVGRDVILIDTETRVIADILTRVL